MNVTNLNLINFEHPTSKSSNYVLTSPKSLKACQKAGVKPVELLYRRLDDVKRAVGKKDAHAAYEQLEQERQKKLEMCRKIRNELLMQGYPYCRNSSPLREQSNSENARYGTPDSSKTGLPSQYKPEALSSGIAEVLQKLPGSSIKCSGELNFVPLPSSDEKTLFGGAKEPYVHTVLRSETAALGDGQGNIRAVEQGERSFLPSLTLTEAGSVGNDSDTHKPMVTCASSVASVDSRSNRPASSKSGKHRRKSFVRSQSLPSRPPTPKDTFSSVKQMKETSKMESSFGNYGDKPLMALNFAKDTNRKTGSVGSSELRLIVPNKQDHHVSFEDINNNNFKTPVIMKSHQRKRRNYENKKLLECKKVFNKIIAQYKDPDYCLMKYRQIIDNSVERELKEQEVRKVQRRIEEGFEMWQDRVLMLQWLDSERADEQISKNLTSKITKMRQTQRNKEIVHAINLNKVKEDDDIRAESLRREVENKERKIQILQDEKERVIFESKSRALAVSELKEQIRSIMTPETFDQKVNKCGRAKKAIRVLHPPGQCSSIMQQSHISLG